MTMPDWVSKYWIEWLFGILAGAIIAGMKRLSKKLKEAQKKDSALEDGMKAILRDRLTQIHDEWMEKGVCPLHVRDNMLNMYQAYHALGGNGAVTVMMNEIQSLPTGTHNN